MGDEGRGERGEGENSKVGDTIGFGRTRQVSEGDDGQGDDGGGGRGIITLQSNNIKGKRGRDKIMTTAVGGEEEKVWEEELTAEKVWADGRRRRRKEGQDVPFILI